MTTTRASASAEIDNIAEQVAAKALELLEGKLLALTPAEPKPLPRFILLADVVAVLGFSKDTFRRFEKAGRVPPRRVLPSGRTGYFDYDLQEALENLTRTADVHTDEPQRQRTAVAREHLARKVAQAAAAEVPTTTA